MIATCLPRMKIGYFRFSANRVASPIKRMARVQQMLFDLRMRQPHTNFFTADILLFCE